MDIAQYRKVNETFRKRLVYHVGKDSGFFVELNYMLHAMLYCLDHRLQFQMYSEDANFGTGTGWTEYFLPFCPEVHEAFHRRYNFHRLPSWKRIMKKTLRERSLRFVVWKLKSLLLTIIGRAKAFRAYGENVLLGQDVATVPASYYHVPELGIDGDYYQAYRTLAMMLWRLRPEIVEQEAAIRQSLHLPSRYAGIQIRGGDKNTETSLISGESIVKALLHHPSPLAPHLSPLTTLPSPIFVLTDDIRLLEAVEAQFPQLHFVSLCRPDDRGYHHRAFCQTDPQQKKEAIVRLLISVDILLRSHTFVGSITTGPSVFVMKVRPDDAAVIAVDCPKPQMKAALTLTVERRAAISNLTLFQASHRRGAEMEQY